MLAKTADDKEEPEFKFDIPPTPDVVWVTVKGAPRKGIELTMLE
jgi:hypothetical protein